MRLKLSNLKTYIVAEIGWNFLGNLKLAKKMINTAKKNGADAAKLQIWDPKYLKEGSWDHDGRREIYNKAKLNMKKYNILKNYCKKNKILCFASVFNLKSCKDLKNNKDKIVKIPSHEAYNKELIKYALKNFNTVILSAGAITQKELKFLEKFKNSNKLIILHCVSSYPLKSENVNFQKFFHLKNIFKKVGYSGHLEGLDDAYLAISSGAVMLEKHFSIDNNLPGRDNKFAILPRELSIIVKYRDKVEQMNKKKGLGLQKCEQDIYKNYRGRWSKNLEN